MACSGRHSIHVWSEIIDGDDRMCAALQCTLRTWCAPVKQSIDTRYMHNPQEHLSRLRTFWSADLGALRGRKRWKKSAILLATPCMSSLVNTHSSRAQAQATSLTSSSPCLPLRPLMMSSSLSFFRLNFHFFRGRRLFSTVAVILRRLFSAPVQS